MQYAVNFTKIIVILMILPLKELQKLLEQIGRVNYFIYLIFSDFLKAQKKHCRLFVPEQKKNDTRVHFFKCIFILTYPMFNIHQVYHLLIKLLLRPLLCALPIYIYSTHNLVQVVQCIGFREIV